MPPSQSSIPARIAALPGWQLFVLLFAGVALTHLTLLHLPYYWDEGGYYIPAALDFYHHGTLVPVFTNAHTPLPNVMLGSLWHIVGFHIPATRLFVCAFAAAGLVAVFRLAALLLDAEAAITVTLLTAAYPIWFAQSSLAHADIFAATFSLWGFVAYFSTREDSRWSWRIAILFSLAALSKETAIVQPAALAAYELYLLATRRTKSFGRLAALSFPLLPLVAWFAYHHAKTGFTFGNPEYLRYNATANFNLLHIASAFRYRAMHLFWQRNIYVPVLLALGCLLLPRRAGIRGLTRDAFTIIALLVAANWIAFSILGGALLTRYLLPVYPLILIVCVAAWQTRTAVWPGLAALTGAAFIAGIWLNPPSAFAPEDNLTYRDMIVVHQQAIDYIAAHYHEARVVTAWPVAADLVRPELGYIAHPLRVWSIDNFSRSEIEKAAQHPEEYDTALVFSTHYVSPPFAHYLLSHPDSRRGREFAQDRDLSPAEAAELLHGTIVWRNNINGEWAAVLRFNRSYEASLMPARLPASAHDTLRVRF